MKYIKNTEDFDSFPQQRAANPGETLLLAFTLDILGNLGNQGGIQKRNIHVASSDPPPPTLNTT